MPCPCSEDACCGIIVDSSASAREIDLLHVGVELGAAFDEGHTPFVRQALALLRGHLALVHQIAFVAYQHVRDVLCTATPCQL